eukprot:TRINITY_DN12634_c0_g1_i10.p1 TRINITY_DN12634_c0_g1~~TRINITY_DN12634_c0_g1_i10.p1  ORF type:complete len:631 (+),score=151.19 TRINITY_DN12634_c0_g1_i10:51-1943(+)
MCRASFPRSSSLGSIRAAPDRSYLSHGSSSARKNFSSPDHKAAAGCVLEAGSWDDLLDGLEAALHKADGAYRSAVLLERLGERKDTATRRRVAEATLMDRLGEVRKSLEAAADGERERLRDIFGLAANDDCGRISRLRAMLDTMLWRSVIGAPKHVDLPPEQVGIRACKQACLAVETMLKDQTGFSMQVEIETARQQVALAQRRLEEENMGVESLQIRQGRGALQRRGSRAGATADGSRTIDDAFINGAGQVEKDVEAELTGENARLQGMLDVLKEQRQRDKNAFTALNDEKSRLQLDLTRETARLQGALQEQQALASALAAELAEATEAKRTESSELLALNAELSKAEHLHLRMATKEESALATAAIPEAEHLVRLNLQTSELRSELAAEKKECQSSLETQGGLQARCEALQLEFREMAARLEKSEQQTTRLQEEAAESRRLEAEELAKDTSEKEAAAMHAPARTLPDPLCAAVSHEAKAPSSSSPSKEARPELTVMQRLRQEAAEHFHFNAAQLEQKKSYLARRKSELAMAQARVEEARQIHERLNSAISRSPSKAGSAAMTRSSSLGALTRPQGGLEAHRDKDLGLSGVLGQKLEELRLSRRMSAEKTSGSKPYSPDGGDHCADRAL